MFVATGRWGHVEWSGRCALRVGVCVCVRGDRGRCRFCLFEKRVRRGLEGGAGFMRVSVFGFCVGILSEKKTEAFFVIFVNFNVFNLDLNQRR